MRKITQQAVNAFNAGGDFSSGNTVVTTFESNVPTDGSYTEMRLHGNKIAYKNRTGLHISNAGWFSNTTKERLNGLAGVSISQKAGVWYLNGKEWDGEWVRVADWK